MVGGVESVDVFPAVFEFDEVVFGWSVGRVVEVDLAKFYAAYHDVVSDVF